METRFAQRGYGWKTLEMMGHSLLTLSRPFRRPLRESKYPQESMLAPSVSVISCFNVTNLSVPMQLWQRADRWSQLVSRESSLSPHSPPSAKPTTFLA